MSKKWSSAIIIKFLELYQERECLWNHKSDLYKDRNLRDDAYLYIVNNLRDHVSGFDVAMAKSKIRSIRNAYMNEHKKVLKSMKSGVSADAVYKPSLAWFHVADRFLKHVVETKETINTLDFSSQDGDDTVEDVGETALDINLGEPQEVLQFDTTAQSTSSKVKNTFPNQPNSKKQKGNRKIEAVSQIVTTLDDILKKAEAPKLDELEAFGQTVVAYLRKMPDHLALDCQSEIMTYLISQKRTLLEPVVSVEIDSIPGPSGKQIE